MNQIHRFGAIHEDLETRQYLWVEPSNLLLGQTNIGYFIEDEDKNHRVFRLWIGNVDQYVVLSKQIRLPNLIALM